MTACSMPRVVTVLDASGQPWFGATWNGSAADEQNVIWLADPIADSDDHYDGGRRLARCTIRAARLVETEA